MNNSLQNINNAIPSSSEASPLVKSQITGLSEAQATDIATTTQNQVHFLSPSNVSENQIRDSYEFAISKGIMTHEQANAHLAQEHGYVPTPIPQQDARNDFQKNFDQTFQGASPNDFQMPYVGSDKNADAIIQGQEMQRKWIAEAGFSKELGNSFINAIEGDIRSFSKLTSSEAKQDWQRQNAEALRAVWKNDYESNIETAKKFIDVIDAKSPGVWNYLQNSGAAYSAAMTKMIFDQAQRLAIRGK